jgi:hypothetical protein
MADTDEIAQWISQLADPDATKRGVAAFRLRVASFSRCFAAENNWIRDPEFRELMSPFAVDSRGEARFRRPPFVLGIAVQPEHFEKIRVANGSPRLADVPPDQDALEFELQFGDNGDLDILTTRYPGGNGAIGRYLQKFGEGVQQIEINVTDVDRGTQILVTRFNLVPIYPATRPGADGTRVNFFLAPAPEGKKILIELVEPSAKS